MRTGLIAQKLGMTRVFAEDARHSYFLGDESGPHAALLQLDLDVDAGGEIELHQRVNRLRRRIDDVE